MANHTIIVKDFVTRPSIEHEAWLNGLVNHYELVLDLRDGYPLGSVRWNHYNSMAQGILAAAGVLGYEIMEVE